MSLLKKGDYDSVRASIDISLDEVQLSDETIALPIYQGSAELDVLGIDPIAETRTDPVQMMRVRRACIFFTASYIILALPRKLKESFGQDYSFTLQEVSRQDLAMALRSRAEAELDAILSPGIEDAERPTMFSVSCQTRETQRFFPVMPIPGSAQVMEN